MKQIVCLALCLALVLCLPSCSKTEAETPSTIMDQCGLNVDVAPDGAQNISYRTLEVDANVQIMAAAEATFTLDGTQYRYRVASYGGTTLDDVYDLSQMEIPDAVNQTAMVGWCDASLVFTPDGAGKIIWFDIAPGLLYSLDMDQGANAEALLAMAEMLYTPAQGDMG